MRRADVIAYGGAVGLVAMITAIKWAVPPLGRDLPFLLYFTGVLLASWRWGRGPGLGAVVTATLAANVLFLPPRGTPSLSGFGLLQTAVFFVEALCFVALVHALRKLAADRDAARAEAVLERERLRAAIEQAPAAVTVLRGPTHVVELANPEAIATSGHRELVGRSLREAAPDLDAATLAKLDAVYHTGEAVVLRRAPLRLAWRNDAPPSTRYFDMSWSPYRAPDGHIQGVIVVSVDVTEQVELVAREKEARNRAEAESRAKDEFLAIVSHELRTPLNAILGWSRLLASGQLTADQTHKAVQTIERNALAQVQLIEDLLDVTRITTGKLRLDVQPVDLLAVVEAATESVRPALDAKQIRLEQRMGAGIGGVTGDPARLQQAVWNLLSNAAKFTPRGGRIVVSLAAFEPHLELRVEDTGVGIGPEFLPYVFDRFRQADGSSTRRQGGLGLGLTITRHIVELHGGTLRAESEGTQRGAAFTMRLPLAASQPTAEAVGPTRSRTALPSCTALDCPPELHGLRVLVIDDEPDALDVVAAVLVRCGAIVRAVGSSEDAFREIERDPPDVVVSDIGMAHEDGYAFIRRVRSLVDRHRASVPAAALTAYARPDDRRRVLLAGFQMHVAKPIEPSELIAVVANLARMRTAA